MIVGFMRIAKRPSQLAKLTAMLCYSKGINLFFMRPADININKNTAKGKLYNGKKWVNREMKIPSIIDINPPCFRKRYESVANHLREVSCLTYDTRGALNKHLLLKELDKDYRFSHLVIPTLKANNFEDVIGFLDEHHSIVLKPINSDRGRGVYKLIREGESYILSYLTKDREFNKVELENYFNEFIQKKNYIAQKYISSRTKNGDPFDCRIHVQKNGKGKWVVARNYVRIGIGQKIISNVNQGGGISDLIPFLKANFGDQWELINKRINELSDSLPYKIEELKGSPTMSLGFDVAINGDGNLYLFESNGAPAVKPVLAKTSLLRVEYYQYLINTIVDKNKISNKNSSNINKSSKSKNEKKKYLTEIKNLKTQINDIKKDNTNLTKEVKDLKNSKSWKLTAPLRKIKSKL